MSIAAELSNLLCAAAGIIQRQAAILGMHGIETENGELEQERKEVLEAISIQAGADDNRCICCGEIIPEGCQVCHKCERR